MSEIAFTRKVGDSAVARPQSAGAATSATGTIANLPTSLSNASAGTLLKALVAAQTLRGFTTLETDKGILMLQTNMPLKVGSELVLQVQSVGAQTRVAILSVDNHPLADGKAAQLVTAKGPTHAGAGVSTPAPSSVPASPGKAPFHGTAASSQTPPEAGQRVMTPPAKGPLATSSRNDSIAVHKGPVAPGLVLPARVLAAGALTVATRAPSQSPSPVTRAVTSGEILTIRVLGFSANGAATPATEIPPAANAIQRGVIVAQDLPETQAMPVGTAPARRPSTVLSVGNGRVALPAAPPGPVGSEVLFEILDAYAPAAAQQNASPVEVHREFLRLGTDWKSMREATTILTAPDAPPPPEGETVVPRPGPQLASAILSFISALKTGDLQAWIGPEHASHLAQASQGQVLNMLRDDFTIMAHHAGDALGTGWHALAVPVHTGVHIEQFRLYYRHQHGRHDAEKDDTGTHFVVEADLSRVGLFQLEGLVRPRQFDLVVRSTKLLSNDMQGAIRGIFHEALTTGDLAGTIRFDGGADMPFNPVGTAYPPASHGAAVIV